MSFREDSTLKLPEDFPGEEHPLPKGEGNPPQHAYSPRARTRKTSLWKMRSFFAQETHSCLDSAKSKRPLGLVRPSVGPPTLRCSHITSLRPISDVDEWHYDTLPIRLFFFPRFFGDVFFLHSETKEFRSQPPQHELPIGWTRQVSPDNGERLGLFIQLCFIVVCVFFLMRRLASYKQTGNSHDHF